MMIDLHSQEQSILVLTPIGKDAELTASVLEGAHLRCELCRNFEDLLQRLSEPYGAILLTEEVLDHHSLERLREALWHQPPWSDIPLVLLTTRGESTETEVRIWSTFASTGNVTLLERPVRTSTLISALQVALRSRRRQYQVKQLLEEQREMTRMRDEFISIASHELKTPITSLKLQGQLSQRQIEKEGPCSLSPERVKKLVEQTNQQIDRLSRLVEDMLDVSRIHVGKFLIQPEEFDFAKMIKESVDRFSPQLSVASCHVVLTVETCVGWWDRYRMEQVVNNLITNAIRYAPCTPIKITLKSDSTHLRLIFQDSGPGIAKEHLESIFQRFERASASHGISGLGLGLYICRQIVEAHGGTIRAESEPGKGASFMVELPIDARSSEKLQEEKQASLISSPRQEQML